MKAALIAQARRDAGIARKEYGLPLWASVLAGHIEALATEVEQAQSEADLLRRMKREDSQAYSLFIGQLLAAVPAGELPALASSNEEALIRWIRERAAQTAGEPTC